MSKFLIVDRLQLHESESSGHKNVLGRTTCGSGGNIRAVEAVIVSLFQETKEFVKVKKKLENNKIIRALRSEDGEE